MRLRFVSEGGNTGAGQLTTVHSASHVTFLTAVRRVPHRYGIIDDNESIDHHDVQNVGSCRVLCSRVVHGSAGSSKSTR